MKEKNKRYNDENEEHIKAYGKSYDKFDIDCEFCKCKVKKCKLNKQTQTTKHIENGREKMKGLKERRKKS